MMYHMWEGSTTVALRCRLAKFRGLMINAEYGAVIGQETCLCVCAQSRVFLSQSQLYSALFIKPRNFAKRQCVL